MLKRIFSRIVPAAAPRGAPPSEAALADDATRDYWTRHNVSLHRQFRDAKESLAYFAWRNDQYFGYLDLMPVDGAAGRAVLDYGCGPGHDLVGFSVYSGPSRLIAMDVSPSSLAEARARLALHDAEAEFVQLDPHEARLPLDDASVDYVHSSGVIHHVPNPGRVLAELHRVLKPGGEARIMVYNHDSIWMHLYVAYHKCILEGSFEGLDLLAAFARSTDGEDCPISVAYRPEAFVALCQGAGFEATFAGAAIAAFEAGLVPTRFDAVRDERLPAESRAFLAGLRFDDRLLPLHNDRVAGVDACFHLRK